MNYDFKQAEKLLEKEFERVNDIRDFNQRKVLKAFFDNKVAPEHFYTVSGYGHDDLGREVLDKVFAQVFGAEKALVRIHFASGTHTLACALFGNLKYGDKLISVAGTPYDTMQEVIGTAGDEETKRSYLIGNGVLYDEVPLYPTENLLCADNGNPPISSDLHGRYNHFPDQSHRRCR